MMKKVLTSFVLFVFVAMFCNCKLLAQCCGGGDNEDLKAETSADSKTKESTKKEAKLPLLLDFGAEKCIPCKKLAPILEEMEKEYKGVLLVKFVDVWKQENVAEAKKYKINSIPTQIFFDEKGKELWRHVGFISKEDMLKKWKELGYDLEDLKKKSADKK
jgi:thioredoxin 1